MNRIISQINTKINELQDLASRLADCDPDGDRTLEEALKPFLISACIGMLEKATMIRSDREQMMQCILDQTGLGAASPYDAKEIYCRLQEPDSDAYQTLYGMANGWDMPELTVSWQIYAVMPLLFEREEITEVFIPKVTDLLRDISRLLENEFPHVPANKAYYLYVKETLERLNQVMREEFHLEEDFISAEISYVDEDDGFFEDEGMTGIVIAPEQEGLREEIQRMRNRIVQLLQERDTLRLVECPGIEARYMTLIGALECQAFREEVAYRRTKRKMEMLQALANRREHIDEEKIEQLLDEQMAEYQQRLDDRIEKLNDMVAGSGSASGDHGSAAGTEEEVRRLYHDIVKGLHPDLHPDQSDQDVEMFYRAQNAYESRDVKALRIIAEALKAEEDLPEDMTGRELRREKERLLEIARGIRQEIAAIKAEYPYTMKELLNDQEWIRVKREELQEQIDNYIRIRREYEGRIRELLKEQG